MATSINGWPVIKMWTSDLATGVVPGTDVHLSVCKPVLPLFLAIAAEYNKTVAPLRKNECGGWNPRKARASKLAWSDHSSGTAIDLNWNHEGAMGAHGGMSTMSPEQIAACVAIKNKFSVIMWGGDKARGGDYVQPKNWDPMHFALKPGTTQSQVNTIITLLGIQGDGIIKPAKPRLTIVKPPKAEPKPKKPKAPAVYKVVKGDSLWSIAKAHKTTVDALCKANQLTPKSVIKPGQSLHLPTTKG